MDWIYQSDDPILTTLAASFLIFIAIIIITRLVGLRSFAKFTAYDFAFTIAIGSIISATLTSSTTVVHGVTAIAALLFLTFIFSFLQRVLPSIKKLTSNKPLLLMDGNQILNENLKHARIEKEQLIAKLREANVMSFDQVEAVVLESTGDISVLHRTEDEDSLHQDILEGVRKKP
ncbi:hypothetical protein BST92_13890 [Nonlabens arenilitoris]|uniref:YetF C-terminal domain-containing protein n=1 Tax=Nonlabens arenilitoris TaxID=1217969 RepID=A0A2S7UDC2_9FLAO|nr:YetF domain-containing protein [Nonlabens arenilitoris]PQJ32948.1 hypothetical protein BST92_13890 [Nonlabens arenilitoris]